MKTLIVRLLLAEQRQVVSGGFARHATKRVHASKSMIFR